MRQRTCFQPAQHPPNCPERSAMKLVIDYLPGPDAVSRVIRKRTVSVTAESREEANRTRSGPPDCPNRLPDCSAARRQFGLAVEPEGIFGANNKQWTYQASGGGPCSAQRDDNEFDQQAGTNLQPSDHRWHRVAPGKICQPKPRPSRPEPCFMPDLQSLAKQQQYLIGPQAQWVKMKPPCKQAKQPTRRCYSAGAEPPCFEKQFPTFMEDNRVGKKKHRVSFAEEAAAPDCTIYSRCGGGEQPCGAQNRKRADQRQAELRNVPCVSDMDPMAYQTPPCPPCQGTRPTCSQQQRQPQKRAQQKRHDEHQWCVGMYQEQQWPADIMEQCKHKKEASIPYKKPQAKHEESSECAEDEDSYEDKKYQFTSIYGEVQQPIEDGSDESDKPNEPARPSGPCKHVKEEDVGGNSLEFEANQDDDDEEEGESPEQPPAATGRSTSKQANLRPSLAAKKLDPCNKKTGSIGERFKSRQSELQDEQRRNSEGYTVQAGVQDRRSSLLEDQKGQSEKAGGVRRSSIGKQMRKTCAKVPDEQPCDGSSKASRSACRDRRERPTCPPPKRPCEDEQQPRKTRQRASSDPCAYRCQHADQRQKEPWKLKCQKTEKSAAAGAASTATPSTPATPGVPEVCKEALREDAERRCRQEKAEKAKEAALKASLQGRSGSSRGATYQKVKPVQVPQPVPVPETEATELCHCSLHSDLSCDTPIDQLSQRTPKKRLENQCEPKATMKLCNAPPQVDSGAESACGSDNTKFIREGHLLVRLDTIGRPTNTKVMSRCQRPCDIYSFCGGQQQGDFGDEKADNDEDKCEEAEDPKPPPPPPPPSEPEDWVSPPEDLPAAENTTGTATTEDTGDPVVRKKKCCC